MNGLIFETFERLTHPSYHYPAAYMHPVTLYEKKTNSIYSHMFSYFRLQLAIYYFLEQFNGVIDEIGTEETGPSTTTNYIDLDGIETSYKRA